MSRIGSADAHRVALQHEVGEGERREDACGRNGNLRDKVTAGAGVRGCHREGANDGKLSGNAAAKHGGRCCV